MSSIKEREVWTDMWEEIISTLTKLVKVCQLAVAKKDETKIDWDYMKANLGGLCSLYIDINGEGDDDGIVWKTPIDPFVILMSSNNVNKKFVKKNLHTVIDSGTITKFISKSKIHNKIIVIFYNALMEYLNSANEELCNSETHEFDFGGFPPMYDSPENNGYNIKDERIINILKSNHKNVQHHIFENSMEILQYNLTNVETLEWVTEVSHLINNWIKYNKFVKDSIKYIRTYMDDIIVGIWDRIIKSDERDQFKIASVLIPMLAKCCDKTTDVRDPNWSHIAKIMFNGKEKENQWSRKYLIYLLEKKDSAKLKEFADLINCFSTKDYEWFSGLSFMDCLDPDDVMATFIEQYSAQLCLYYNEQNMGRVSSYDYYMTPKEPVTETITPLIRAVAKVLGYRSTALYLYDRISELKFPTQIRTSLERAQFFLNGSLLFMFLQLTNDDLNVLEGNRNNVPIFESVNKFSQLIIHNFYDDLTTTFLKLTSEIIKYMNLPFEQLDQYLQNVLTQLGPLITLTDTRSQAQSEQYRILSSQLKEIPPKYMKSIVPYTRQYMKKAQRIVANGTESDIDRMEWYTLVFLIAWSTNEGPDTFGSYVQEYMDLIIDKIELCLSGGAYSFDDYDMIIAMLNKLELLDYSIVNFTENANKLVMKKFFKNDPIGVGKQLMSIVKRILKESPSRYINGLLMMIMRLFSNIYEKHDEMLICESEYAGTLNPSIFYHLAIGDVLYMIHPYINDDRFEDVEEYLIDIVNNITTQARIFTHYDHPVLDQKLFDFVLEEYFIKYYQSEIDYCDRILIDIYKIAGMNIDLSLGSRIWLKFIVSPLTDELVIRREEELPSLELVSFIFSPRYGYTSEQNDIIKKVFYPIILSYIRTIIENMVYKNKIFNSEKEGPLIVNVFQKYPKETRKFLNDILPGFNKDENANKRLIDGIEDCCFKWSLYEDVFAPWLGKEVKTSGSGFPSAFGFGGF